METSPPEHQAIDIRKIFVSGQNLFLWICHTLNMVQLVRVTVNEWAVLGTQDFPSTLISLFHHLLSCSRSHRKRGSSESAGQWNIYIGETPILLLSSGGEKIWLMTVNTALIKPLAMKSSGIHLREWLELCFLYNFAGLGKTIASVSFK